LMGDAPVKAALAAVIGLSLATVGLDSNSGVYRFTGGDVHLSDGIQFIVLVIGLFSISEILLMLEQHHSSRPASSRPPGASLFNLKEMTYTWWSTIRSSLVGFVVGVLPGAGATIASAMTYTMEKRLAGSDNWASATATSAAWRRRRRPTTPRRPAPSCPCSHWACPARAPRR
jgi:putative tricarboxylic transport membrane protein